MPACKDYCPVAHTCFSIIDLPDYSSKEMLSKMIACAVTEGKGFTVSWKNLIRLNYIIPILL